MRLRQRSRPSSRSGKPAAWVLDDESRAQLRRRGIKHYVPDRYEARELAFAKLTVRKPAPRKKAAYRP